MRRRASLVVRTTLDQDAAARRRGRGAGDLSRSTASAGEVEQAALVAMTPDGQVRAMLGGRAYAASQFNRATQAERQPGSAFKLFVYLAALEAGLRAGGPDLGRADPGQRLAAAQFRRRLSAPDLGWSTPSPTRSTRPRCAWASRSAATRVIRLAERLGITSQLRDEPSLALGSSEVRLLELTAAYAEVANGGHLVWPEGIEQIAGGDEALYQRRPVDEPVLEPAVVRAMTAMLETALERGTGRQAALRRFAAGKTGTSSDHRDAWFVGFTDELVVGVWVGNDDGRPMRGRDRRRPAGADLSRVHPARPGRCAVPATAAARKTLAGHAGRDPGRRGARCDRRPDRRHRLVAEEPVRRLTAAPFISRRYSAAAAWPSSARAIAASAASA